MDFQQQLDNEIERRGLNKSDGSENPTTPKKSNFSFSAFFKGIVICSLFMGGLVGWAFLKANETQEYIIATLPSKTAVIVTESGQKQTTADVKPTIRMPEDAREVEPVEAIPPQNVAKTTIIEETPEEITPLEDIEENAQGMVPAPVPGLYENKTYGQLPKQREKDGLTSFKAYKRPFVKSADKPVISIVITNLGLSSRTTDGIIKNFPADISLAFSPYTNAINSTIKEARDDGHEAWLMLPIETKNYPLDDPGPNTILSNASVRQNKDRLYKSLGDTGGIVGVIPFKNHIFIREDANINLAIKDLFSRGLAFLDSRTSVQTFVQNLAEKEGYIYGRNNFWLDENITPLAMNQMLRKTMDHAKANGSAILMLRPYPASIKTLQKFLNSNVANEFQLAPASAVVSYEG